MINFASFLFPYSLGLNPTLNSVPFFPNGSNIPLVGSTENSLFDSAVKYALKLTNSSTLFVNLNCTLLN